MRGRPKRAFDAGLAERARKFEQIGCLSSRQASVRLGIEPSTYARCMRACAFSTKTAALLERALDREGVPPVAQDKAHMPLEFAMRLLQIFEEGATILTQFRGGAEASVKSSKRPTE